MKFAELIDKKPKKLLYKIIMLVILICVFTTSDLVIKEIASRNLKDSVDVVVIPGFWSFHYVINDDIGFSVLRWLNKYLNPGQKWLFLVTLQGLGTVVVIGFYFYSKQYKYLIPLGLIVCGALGNVTDRIIRGFVVDYVKWYHNDFIWPIFNLADVLTVTGAIMLLAVLFFYSKEN
jgi:signal peptidase II